MYVVYVCMIFRMVPLVIMFLCSALQTNFSTWTIPDMKLWLRTAVLRGVVATIANVVNKHCWKAATYGRVPFDLCSLVCMAIVSTRYCGVWVTTSPLCFYWRDGEGMHLSMCSQRHRRRCCGHSWVLMPLSCCEMLHVYNHTILSLSPASMVGLDDLRSPRRHVAMVKMNA